MRPSPWRPRAAPRSAARRSPPTGSFSVPLSTAQRDSEVLVIRQADAAGNISPPTNAVAPDLTAPEAPTGLAVAGDGATLTGAGEAGARVEVRGGGLLLGTATVAADGSFTVPLAPAQVTGATLSVTQADAAGNVSGVASVGGAVRHRRLRQCRYRHRRPAARGDRRVNAGRADYVALVSLGLLNLQAQVLAVPNVRFTVQPGHSLDAVFTYDATLNIGCRQRLCRRRPATGRRPMGRGSRGAGQASLLEVGLLNGNLSATDTLGAGRISRLPDLRRRGRRRGCSAI
ncbi:MAG: Ig-like domain-containing protein [Sphingomonas taxi]